MQLKRLAAIAIIAISIWACKEDNSDEEAYENKLAEIAEEEEEILEFGFELKDYIVKRETIKKGDRLGEI